jgi:hypothetical protein
MPIARNFDANLLIRNYSWNMDKNIWIFSMFHDGNKEILSAFHLLGLGEKNKKSSIIPI